MGQILHGSARTTAAVRRAIQHSQESLRALAARYDINPKTVAKWRRRQDVEDAPMGPLPRSTTLSPEQEAIVVAFRKHILLPLDDCLYALQATIPRLTRSALHRCFVRHEISRLPEVEGHPSSSKKKKFQAYPIGYFHLDIAEVATAEGRLYLFVAIDRTSKFAVDQRPGRTHEPHHQGSHRAHLSLHHSRSTPGAPGFLPRRLQLRQTPQNPRRSYPLPVHLFLLPKRT